jgi:hypothetical protein
MIPAGTDNAATLRQPTTSRTRAQPAHHSSRVGPGSADGALIGSSG